MDDINPPNNFGTTPLHTAAANRKSLVCKLIVDKVDNKNPQNTLGLSPLHSAIFGNSSKCLKILMQNVESMHHSILIMG